VTTPDGGRGGSVPPRPPAGKPQQWFTLRPWVFDVTLAGVLLRAAPRPPVPIPVAAWARAYGLAPRPRHRAARHLLIDPDFNPGYAMTTDPDEPVILATLTDAAGQPVPLLIDGCHRLYKAAVTGRAEIPAFVLTTAETLLTRSDAVLGPPRPAHKPDAAPGHRTAPAPLRWRRPPMLTGITTRTSTPQEDAEQWAGGSARPVLDYLTGTLGMTDADADALLKAARTAQAETGPGAIADYPVPRGDAHLLIHYAPGSRAYRFKLTTPKNEVPPLDPPEQFAGGDVVAAARCPVDVSTHPRRHVIVVRHAGDRQSFSVHEVAHNHVEWVAGQGHYDLGYAGALRRMVEKAVGQA